MTFLCYTFLSNRPHLSCVAHLSFKPLLSWHSWGRRERKTEDERRKNIWRTGGISDTIKKSCHLSLKLYFQSNTVCIIYRNGSIYNAQRFPEKKYVRYHCKITFFKDPLLLGIHSIIHVSHILIIMFFHGFYHFSFVF